MARLMIGGYSIDQIRSVFGHHITKTCPCSMKQFLKVEKEYF